MSGSALLFGEGDFRSRARVALANGRLRANLGRATTTIRSKRAAAVGEVAEWQELRKDAAAAKDAVLEGLDGLLVLLEERFVARGGVVHWARDAKEANEIVVGLVRSAGATEVVKVKSMTTQEIGLNEALGQAGIAAWETDLAELIVQLSNDRPSHFLVPAIHRSRAEIRRIFLERMPGVEAGLGYEPEELTAAARSYLRQKFLDAKVAISGANFAVAETGTLGVVESEGNARMCLSLPPVLITVMGIEKVVARWHDLGPLLRLLPRSSTAERMNPYTSTWSGPSPGDGPAEVHLVLVDNGRSAALADPLGRQALRCIRCSACLNVCPVYERVGGHAYGSVYPGPIGAVITPLLLGVGSAASLPFASSLCGACYEVCPVAIDIPSLLVHLRAREVRARKVARGPSPESAAMAAASWVMSDASRWGRANRLARRARGLARSRWASLLPLTKEWAASRELPPIPEQTFRQWWEARAPGGARQQP